MSKPLEAILRVIHENDGINDKARLAKNAVRKLQFNQRSFGLLLR